MIGKSIAHYEIKEKLGQGGMGEVYRARDTKLNRDVALKILPQIFAQDEQRMGRFQREAQVLASLNHPSIASIYGLEEANGTKALVMELVEGEDLSERIASGPIRLEEALPIALQIAEALEDAHEKGIIHRDLKPANIKLTPEGKVKILDFGLAKALEEERAQEEISNSPTLTMQATQAGIILGTAAYMSPEQAKGKAVDRRVDIWAFGAVLYEMLTGQQAFQGADITEVMASVVKVDIDWNRLPDFLPLVIRKLLKRCLRADLRRRLHDIADFRLEIEEYLADPSEAMAVQAVDLTEPVSRRRQILPWSLTGLFFLTSLATLWLLWPQPETREPPRRLRIEPGEGAAFSFDGLGGAGVLSPDESMIVFLGRAEGGSNRLYLRRLDRLEATPLPGTKGAVQAVFSPDNQWIAFRADQELKKIAVKGGSALTLCSAGAAHGISWGEDGSIVFAPSRTGGLSTVPAIGGTPEPLTILAEEEATHRWPQVLRGGQAVLFTACSKDGRFDEARIVAQRLPNGEKKVLWQGGYHGRYLPTGHLVYLHQGTLFAAPFDLDSLRLRGQPAPILEGVRSNATTGFSGFTFSDRGSLLYVPGEADEQRFQLEWLNPEGGRQELPLQPERFRDFRLSPSGKLLALDIHDGQQWDIWTYDIERDTLTRLTFDPADDEHPVWSPSGRSIVFASSRAGASNLYLKPVDGSGEVQRLTESENNQFPASWHRGGRFVAFWESTPENAQDIRVLELEGDDQSGCVAKEAVTYLSTPEVELRPQFSPDGNWLAYFSNESGRWETYVRAFPGPGGRWQISTEGGWQTRWMEGSQQLYFEWSGRLFVSQYRVQGTSFLADRAVELPNGSISTRTASSSFDLHPDGRILVRKRPGESGGSDEADRLVLFENFFDYLKEKVPVE